MKTAMRLLPRIALIAGIFFSLVHAPAAQASMAGSGGPKPDSAGTDEPVNLSNGNLFVPVTDVRIPGRGPGLELTRTYNSQVISHLHKGWDVGLGTWVIENGEVSGEGGQIWHPRTWGDFDLSIRTKTIAQDPEGKQPDLEFYTSWIHFRFQDYNNHYQLLMKTTGVVELVKYYVESGQVKRYFWRKETSFSPFQWNTFRVKMIGGQITVWVNGTVAFTFLDAKPLPAGRIGLESHYCHAHWDDMTLANLATGSSHSHDFNEPNQEGMFGYGWSSNLEMQILEDMPENGMTMLIREDGRQDHFMRDANGSYMAPLGIHDQLSKEAGGYTLRRKDGLTWKFDLQGRLISVADRNGNVTVISRDTSGRPATVTDPSGRILTFTYGANGKVSQVTDPAGRQWLYAYDPANHLTQVTNPLGLKERYAYDLVTHNLIRLTDKAGAVFQYTYTIDDRVKIQTDPLGKVTTFTWQAPYAGLGGTATTIVTHADGSAWSYRFKLEDETRPDVHDQIHVITDPFGNAEGFAWDTDKNRIGKTDESGRSVFWEYDPKGNPTKIIQFVPPAGSGKSSVSILKYEPVFNQITALYDPNEHETHYEYDPKGNLTKLWRPFNYVDRVENSYTYDSSGQVLTATDPLGRQTSFSYNAHGNVVSVTDAMGNVTAAVYDILGRPTSTTDPKGNPTRYAWDAGDRLVKVTDALGGETLYEYDGNGNVVAVTDPEGNTTRLTYDGVGNLTQVTDPLGNVTRYAWDTADFMHFGTSRLTGMTDPKGNTTRYEYDKRGRLVKITDAKGGMTRYGYDKTTHVTSITDANNHTTIFEYDDMERLTRAVDPLGNVTSFGYDRLGHLTSKTNAEGQTTTYTYDELDRLKKITYADGSTVTYTYDKAGNRTQMTDNSAVTVYTYDALNRLTSTYPGSFKLAVTYAYDAVGNRLRMESPFLVGVTTYTYDALNRMTRLTDPQNGTYDFNYDRASRRTSLRFPNGMTTTYGYDAANRLARLETKNSSIQSLLALAYAYDPAGDVLSVTRSPAGTAGAGIATYAYDALHQLIQAGYPDGSNDSFTYDPVGNRLTANGTPYLYDTANRLTKAGLTTYAHDKAGNRTAQHGPSGTSMAFTYDGANRLAAVDKAQALNLSLSSGWNFVTNPFLAGSADITAALSPLQLPSDYDQVTRYNSASGAFEHFVGVAPYDQFNTLDPARGYQLYVTKPGGASVSLSQAGPSSAQTISLTVGWNLIGSPRSEPLPTAQALAPLQQGVDYDSVMELDPATSGYRTATTLRPGAAYWLRTLRPAALTIPAATSHAVTYAYDGDGRRVSKTINGVTTRYLYDGLEILAELDGSNNVLTSATHGPGIDQVLATRDHATAQTLYHLADHLGSTVALVDAGQQVQATFSYAAFGATRASTGSAGTRFGFTGRENDLESGLMHYRARAYDPAVGRFLQPDPLPRTPADPRVMGLGYVSRLAAVNHPLPGAVPGFLPTALPAVMMSFQTGLLQNPLGLNAYTYVLNNPLRFTDPLGLEPKGSGLDPGKALKIAGKAVGKGLGRGLSQVGRVLSPGGPGRLIGGILGGTLGTAVGLAATGGHPAGGIGGGILGGIVGGELGGAFDSPGAGNAY